MARQFRVPVDAAPKRYLFVGNCGPRVGLERDDVEKLFAPFGPVEVDITEEQKSYLFVTFPDVERAQAAKHHFTEVDTERRFIIRYTDVKRPKHYDRVPVLCHEAEECGIPGLQLLKDFINEEEEKMLLTFLQDEGSEIDWEWHTGRYVAHFGIPFDYATRNVDLSREVRPFPELLAPMVQRIENCEAVPVLDQLTVNCYPSGIGLASHIDSHTAFSGSASDHQSEKRCLLRTGAIVALSTGSAAIMQFKKGKERRRILLPRRSLLIMADEARYCWQHYIPHNRLEREASERYSLTFRQARGFPCNCAYPEYCDSQEGALPPTRMLLQRQQGESGRQGTEEHVCQSLEEEYVHQVYDVIARHFSATRFAVWPKVRSYLESLDPGSMMVDVGCGNGKYFNVRRDLIVVGFDHSEGLLRAALERQMPNGLPFQNRSFVDVAVADGMHLPLRDATMDAALCIAVMHHVSSINRRLRILKEITRVLRPNGTALITVWAQEQEDVEKTICKWRPIQHQDDPDYVHDIVGELHGEDYFVPWHLPLHRIEGQIAAQEILNEEGNGGTINEEKRSVMFHRYYHLYVKGELERLCAHVENAQILDAFYDKSNWCVILQKCL